MVYPQLDSSASLSNIWGVKEGIAGLIIRLGHGVGFKSECWAARQHSNLLGHLWTSSSSDMAKGFSGCAHLLCLWGFNYFITAHFGKTRRFLERLDLANRIDLFSWEDLAKLMVGVVLRLIVQLAFSGRPCTFSLHDPKDNLIWDGMYSSYNLICDLIEASSGFYSRVRLLQRL